MRFYELRERWMGSASSTRFVGEIRVIAPRRGVGFRICRVSDPGVSVRCVSGARCRVWIR